MHNAMETDQKWMARALELAAAADLADEVPVGAVLVCEDQIIAEARNDREAVACATRHGELIAIQEACKKLGRWRLNGCTLYVTLEPCLMCAGAIVQARIDRVVIGARDPKAGAVFSLYQVLNDSRLNHRPDVVEGVLASASSELLKSFFQRRRQQNKG